MALFIQTALTVGVDSALAISVAALFLTQRSLLVLLSARSWCRGSLTQTALTVCVVSALAVGVVAFFTQASLAVGVDFVLIVGVAALTALAVGVAALFTQTALAVGVADLFT